MKEGILTVSCAAAMAFALLVICPAAAFAQTIPAAQPAAVQPPPPPPVTVMPQIMAAPVAQASHGSSLTTTALAADTFVSIKDHGDSQTILVYKIDELGNVRLTSKKKFMY
ncbi:MAG: hypothetical protein WC889_07130 [Myxococcota bacterium]